MTITSLKKQIIRKVDNTLDEGMLEIINKLLDKAQLDPLLKEKLTRRALQSEKNIQSGKVYSRSEALKKIRK